MFSKFGKNMRKTWQLINTVLHPNSKRNNLPNKLISKGVEITNSKIIMDEFCSYFASSGKLISEDILVSASSTSDFKKYLGPSCQKSMVLDPVSEFEVQRIVSELIGSSSCGPDQIPAKALKFILPSILSPLTILVNLSFLNGTFPSALKSARLVVLHKGGSRDDPSNYRPISLLSAFSKIFEKFINSELLSFFL